MHDCPGCQVPLHGHELFCPVCGVKQHVRPEYRAFSLEQYQKGFNPLGLIFIVTVVGGFLIFAVQNSWIGQLMKRGPEKPAGDSALSAPAAREKLESSVLQNLSGQSKTCKFVYMADEKTVDRNYPKTVALTIDVNLKNPSIRKSIVEPAKGLMVPGQISTLVLNDSHSGATITYSVAGGGTDESDAEDKNPAKTPERDTSSQ